MSDRLQRSMALMDAKADVKMIKERTNECWYDTKILANAVYLILEELTATDTADTPQTERMKTHDYCDICNHKGCGTCIANNLDDYCVPSNYEPTTQTETQNSNLTFDTPQTDCEACELDGKADACKICRVSNYEPQTDCGWK
jgi:hypothetical protein